MRASDDFLLAKRAADRLQEDKSSKARSFDAASDGNQLFDNSAEDAEDPREREANAGAAAAILVGFATPKNYHPVDRYHHDHNHNNLGPGDLLPAVRRRGPGQNPAESRRISDESRANKWEREERESRKHEGELSPSRSRERHAREWRDGSKERVDGRLSPQNRVREHSREKQSRDSSNERYGYVGVARKDRKMEREKDMGYAPNVHDERRLVDRRKGKVRKSRACVRRSCETWEKACFVISCAKKHGMPNC